MGRIAVDQRLLLVLGSLALTGVALEIAVRLLMPPPQMVEVDVRPVRPQPGKKREVEERQSHQSVIDWSGHQGVRLRRNTRARIINHSLSKRDVTIETNSVGLRYDELGPKPADEFRVLVVGDSITFGDFVEARETYTAVLEQLARGGAKRVRFINAGLPGASTSEEFYLYMELRDLVQPDLVLVELYLNDSQDSDIFRARSIPPPFSHSRLVTLLVNRFEVLRTRLWEESAIPSGIAPDWREEFRAGRSLRSGDMLHSRDGFDFEIYNAHMDFGLAWNPESWRIVEKILRVWKQAVDETSARLAVAMFPVHIQVLGTIDDFRPQEECRRICQRFGIPFHDLIPALRADWQKQAERLFHDHCHPTPYGYRVVAKDLFAWLTGEGLVPRPPGD